MALPLEIHAAFATELLQIDSRSERTRQEASLRPRSAESDKKPAVHREQRKIVAQKPKEPEASKNISPSVLSFRTAARRQSTVRLRLGPRPSAYIPPPASAPLRKLSVELIDTYKHINQA